MEMYRGISGLLGRCVDDMNEIAVSGVWTSEMAVRAYDLLSELMDLDPGMQVSALSEEAVRGFCSVYMKEKAVLEKSFDEDALKDAVSARLAPLERACTDTRFEAASAASLHEFAKETFEIWQTAGIFMRKRALKALRERAGFRLESHRIGNYVAKTFDLMNEAQARFARAQQAVFSADVRYKIQPGVYGKIYDLLYRLWQ